MPQAIDAQTIRIFGASRAGLAFALGTAIASMIPVAERRVVGLPGEDERAGPGAIARMAILIAAIFAAYAVDAKFCRALLISRARDAQGTSQASAAAGSII